MSFTVFLGNLPVWVTADDIKQWLAAEDLVADAVKVIRNHETQESKGFAFVEMGSDAEAQAAIQGLNGHDHGGRNLTVNEAKPREPRTSGGGGYGGRGGGGRSGDDRGGGYRGGRY